MPKKIPLPERILDATELALRRYGAEKTNVVDISRALEMSHGNIYRHFPSKKALLDAVAHRWLHTLLGPLEAIVTDTKRSAAARLTDWFDALRKMKLKKLREDPELFRMHLYITESARELVDEHVAKLLNQVERIIAAGVTQGEFHRTLNAKAGARAFLLSTAPFHHPALLLQGSPPREADARLVLSLMLAGFRRGIA